MSLIRVLAHWLLQNRKRLFTVVAIWWFAKFISGLTMIAPGPWGPTVEGKLPDGRRVLFCSRFYGRETDDVLVVKEMGGMTERWYWINNSENARIGYVRLAVDSIDKVLWVEANGKVVASLDLVSDRFYRAKLPSAIYGSGTTVVQGRTRGFWQYVVPW